MAIHKLVIQTTVLVEADSLAEAVNSYSNLTLSEIEDACDDQDIGSGISIVSSKTLTDREEITDELLQMGNDGTFFDHVFEGTDDYVGAAG
jgi:hypothetical protein